MVDWEDWGDVGDVGGAEGVVGRVTEVVVEGLVVRAVVVLPGARITTRPGILRPLGISHLQSRVGEGVGPSTVCAFEWSHLSDLRPTQVPPPRWKCDPGCYVPRPPTLPKHREQPYPVPCPLPCFPLPYLPHPNRQSP